MTIVRKYTVRRCAQVSQFLTILFAAFALSLTATSAQTVVDVDALRLAFYSYDPTIALNPELKELTEAAASKAAQRTRFHLTYESAHDQRVTAIVSIPKKYA